MNTERKLYQWDTGQKLTGCTGLYVDFPIDNEVYRVETTDGTCIIPDELLQTSGGHKVYECMTNNTIRSFAFSVTPRPKPPDYVYTPTERLTFEGLVQKVDDAVADMIRRAESGEFDGHTPVKGTDYFTTEEIQQIQNEVSSGAIGDFKTIVDTETETFNTNATEKVNTYNQNASQKTASYNTNATAKLNAYNANANNRLAEFDSHTEQIQTDISGLKNDLTDLGTKTRNLFYEDYVLKDAYVDDSGKVQYELKCAGIVFPCSENTTYTFSNALRKGTVRVSQYSEKPVIGSVGTQTETVYSTNKMTVTTGANVSYLFFWIYNSSGEPNTLNDVVNSCQIEVGDSQTEYIKPYSANDREAREIISDLEEDVNNLKTVSSRFVENIYDKNKSEVGKIIFDNGSITENASYVLSDYLSVNEGDTIYCTLKNGALGVGKIRTLCAFDKNKNVLPNKGVSDDTIKYTVPSNVHFVRVSLYANAHENICINTVGIWSDYGSAILSKNIKSVIYPRVIIPKEICVAVGKTIEIYDKQVCVNSDKYHVRWSSPVGCQYKRKLQITGTDNNVGTYSAKFEILDDDLTVIYGGSFSIKIVSDNMQNSLSICPIGDSLTNRKQWLPRLKEMNSNINFVGTRWGDSSKESSQYFHEGRSGADAGWYLKDSVYTFDSYGDTNKNPFYNPSSKAFDFSYYKSTYDVNPNAVILFLGTNGLSLDNTDNASNILNIINGIRNADNSIPIYVVNTLYGGNQDGIAEQQKDGNTDGYAGSMSGMNKYEQDCKILDLIEKLYSMVDSLNDTNIHFAPVAFCHDSEYNFGAKEINVNPYSEQKEVVPIECTHPQTSGYNQIADIIYSTLCAYQTT